MFSIALTIDGIVVCIVRRTPQSDVSIHIDPMDDEGIDLSIDNTKLLAAALLAAIADHD